MIQWSIRLNYSFDSFKATGQAIQRDNPVYEYVDVLGRAGFITDNESDAYELGYHLISNNVPREFIEINPCILEEEQV